MNLWIVEEVCLLIPNTVIRVAVHHLFSNFEIQFTWGTLSTWVQTLQSQVPRGEPHLWQALFLLCLTSLCHVFSHVAMQAIRGHCVFYCVDKQVTKYRVSFGRPYWHVGYKRTLCHLLSHVNMQVKMEHYNLLSCWHTCYKYIYCHLLSLMFTCRLQIYIVSFALSHIQAARGDCVICFFLTLTCRVHLLSHFDTQVKRLAFMV